MNESFAAEIISQIYAQCMMLGSKDNIDIEKLQYPLQNILLAYVSGDQEF